MQPLWRTVWTFLKQLKIELPYGAAIPLLGIYLEKMKTLIQKDTCTPMFIAVLFIIAKTGNNPSAQQQMIGVRHTHTHSGILLSQRQLGRDKLGVWD